MFNINDLFLFEGMAESDRAQVCASLSESIAFEKGDIIYDNAHFQRALGVFLCGKGIAGDRDATKTSFSEGDVFGAAALFGAGESYVSRITARTACRVLFIPEETLRAIMEKYPSCAVNYVAFLSGRIRYLNGKIAQYTGESAAARFYRLLCDKADENGWVKNVNVSSLAGLSGLGRTSAYRALAELEADGSIKRENKNIFIWR